MPADTTSVDPYVFLANRANRQSFPPNVRDAITNQNILSVPSPHPEHYGRTLLHLAVWEDNREAAQFLIEQGADINALDELHDSPFLLVGAEGRKEILAMMLDNADRVAKSGVDAAHRKRSTPDFSVLNRFGGNSLIPACERGHVECARLLMERTDINVDHMNFYHLTGMIEAVMIGGDDKDHVDIVKMLLAHNANPNLVNAEGKTSLRMAKEMGFKRLTKILEEVGGHE